MRSPFPVVTNFGSPQHSSSPATTKSLVGSTRRPQLAVVLLLGAMLFLVACGQGNAPVAIKTANRSAENSESRKNELVDLNSASKTQLISLPGIGEAHAQQIIDGRPYRDKRELMRKNIISEKTYELISERVIAKQN